MAIYLDNNSTTPMDPKVLESMLPYFTKHFGNPSSKSHVYGWEAEQAVKDAQRKITDLLDLSDPSEIIFTSGTTEANNLAISGLLHGFEEKIHAITQKTEHPSVLEVFRALEKEGYAVTYLNVDSEGKINLQEVERAITPQTRLISIMAANNEIGTLQPISELAALCRNRGIIFHTDAAQAPSKIQISAKDFDLMSLSAHKIHGPVGIGLLTLRRQKPPIYLKPLFHGGGQQRGLRSGTLPVALIVGLAKSLELAISNQATEAKRLQELAFKLWEPLQKKGAILNGPTIENRLPGNLNFSLPGLEAEKWILKNPEFALSTGSACASGSNKPSHVLSAITQDKGRIQAALRIGMGRFTTDEDIQKTISIFQKYS